MKSIQSEPPAMLFAKIFAVSTAFLVTRPVLAENGVSCHYRNFASRFYICEMRLEDLEDFDEVAGDHWDSKTDNDVTRVDLGGKAENFPSIICSQFKNLVKIISTSDLELKKLSVCSLASCENLVELHLEAGLEEIEKGAFSKTINLEVLRLNSNQLTSLPKNLFRNLKRLKELNLAGNQFHNLSDKIFAPLSSSLEKLVLNNCNLSDWNALWLQDLELLTYVDLGSNKIQEIPRNSFHPDHKISALFLDKNQIESLDFFSFGKLENLEFFHAEGNNISALDFYIFEQPKKLKFVHLEGNSCVNGDDHTFEDIYEDKSAIMENLKECFVNFDKKTISE
jgi:BspA type Leucine rich repeat region (6 copies)